MGEKAFHYQPWTPLSLLLSYGYEILFICPEGIVEHRPTMEQPFPAEYVAGYNSSRINRSNISRELSD